MGRGPRAEAVPGLAHALRLLRRRSGLTQAGLAAAVRAGGGSLSTVYYQQIEAGSRFPSPPMRARILEALGAGDGELAQLLDRRPWESGAGAPAPRERWSSEVVPAPGRRRPAPAGDAAVRARIADIAARLEGDALTGLLADARRRAGEAP